MKAPLRLGTRRSNLATSQSRLVAEALTAATGRDVELVEVTTAGDVSRASLSQIGGTGVFVSALRDALLRGEVDLAVHSLKDIPTTPEPGLVIAAVPKREDPRDALVARDGLTLGELPEGSVVGTGSPRRAAQLMALGLGLEIRDIRGNVDTRLTMVDTGELDAVVLAHAGLRRVGYADRVTEVIDPLQILSAPGQGALAVECREDDEETLAACRLLDDQHTRASVEAERALLAALEAGCTAPLGALAVVGEGDDGPELYLRAVVAATDGSGDLRRSATGPLEKPEDLGRRLAALMIEDGAAGLMGKKLMGKRPDEPDQLGEPAGTGRQPGPAGRANELQEQPIETTGGEPATVESET